MNRLRLGAALGVLIVVSFAGVSLINTRVSGKEDIGAGGRIALYYRDPMHPSYTSDRPGRAPDCGMALEPVFADAQGEAPGTVHISSERQQLIGVRLGRVDTSEVTQPLRAFGRVVLDDARIFPLSAGAEGWVETVFPISTGNEVKKGQPLVTVYGRDYMTAQRTFLYALQAIEKAPESSAGLQNQSAFNLQEARLTLQSLAFDERQIQQMMGIRQALLHVNLVAPEGGIVVARNVFPQQRFDRGAELFRIADLSHVWIVADMFGAETQYVRKGATARVSVPGRRDLTFPATVSDVLSRYDPMSRTYKVRLEAANPGLTLRPDMSVDIDFPVRLPAAITVPRDAVLESGLRETVFVDKGQGVFEARTVETGWHFGDRVQIVRGLLAGESIVVSGNFLLDAESRLRQGAASGHD